MMLSRQLFHLGKLNSLLVFYNVASNASLRFMSLGYGIFDEEGLHPISSHFFLIPADLS